MTLTAPNLNALPAPEIISVLDFEAVFAEMKAELLRLEPSLATVLEIESEPITKLAQAVSYRILHERKLANDQAQGLMLATASGAQLDHLGALPFISTVRQVIAPADNSTNPITEAILESDTDYRARLQLALEGYTTAGSIGSYIYHGLAASSDVKDIAIATPTFVAGSTSDLIHQQGGGRTAATGSTNGSTITLTPTDTVGLDVPLPGDVAITVLSRTGNGAAPQSTLDAVATKLTAETIRPITDRPRVRSAEILEYAIDAKVFFDSTAPDQGIILAAAKASAERYVSDLHRIGRDVTISGLHAAIHQAGIVKVALNSPSSDLVINEREAGYCTSITLNNAGVME